MPTIEEVGRLIEAAGGPSKPQFGFVGTDGIAIIGTGEYRQKVGTRRPRGCYLTRPTSKNNIHIISNPGNSLDCASCESKDSCAYSVVLCAPVFRNSDLIGAIGLMGKEVSINENILQDKKQWVEYLENLAGFLSEFSYLTSVMETRSMTDEMLNSAFHLDGKQGLTDPCRVRLSPSRR